MALYSIDPLSTNSWNEIQKHFDEIHDVDVRNLFRIDKDRFTKFSIQLDDLFFDFSKNILTDKTLDLFAKIW